METLTKKPDQILSDLIFDFFVLVSFEVSELGDHLLMSFDLI